MYCKISKNHIDKGQDFGEAGRGGQNNRVIWDDQKKIEVIEWDLSYCRQYELATRDCSWTKLLLVLRDCRHQTTTQELRGHHQSGPASLKSRLGGRIWLLRMLDWGWKVQGGFKDRVHYAGRQVPTQLRRPNLAHIPLILCQPPSDVNDNDKYTHKDKDKDTTQADKWTLSWDSSQT